MLSSFYPHNDMIVIYYVDDITYIYKSLNDRLTVQPFTW